MKKIELLPKFYSNAERNERTAEMKKAIDELLTSDLLSDRVKEKVKEVIYNMAIIADTYSRNYEIKKLNNLIDYFNRIEKER